MPHDDLLGALERARAELTRAHEHYVSELTRAHAAYLDAARDLHARIAALGGGGEPVGLAPASRPDAPSPVEAFGAWPDLPERPAPLEPGRPVKVTADRAGLFAPLCDALATRGISATPISSPDDLPRPPALFDLVLCEPFPEPEDREDASQALDRCVTWREAAGHARSVTTVQATGAGFGLRPASPHLAPLTAAAALSHDALAIDTDGLDLDAAAAAIARALTSPGPSHLAISSRGEEAFGWARVDLGGEDLPGAAPSPLSAPGPVWIVGALPEPFASSLYTHLDDAGARAHLLVPPGGRAQEWPLGERVELDLERDVAGAFDALTRLARQEAPGALVLAGAPDDEHALAWATVALLHAPDAAVLCLHSPARDPTVAALLDATAAAHVEHTPGRWRSVTAAREAHADDMARALAREAPTIVRVRERRGVPQSLP
jgi:hypothetical protein